MKKLLIVLLFPFLLAGQVFPGAVGFGADWTFPAATAEYINVTNPNDTGTGSLRDAISKANGGGFTARIITFYGLSGIITLSTPLDISRNNTYIAGQTSPNGILLRSASNVDVALMRTNNNVNGVIVRGITFAHGGGRTNSVNGDNVTFLSGQNIVFDRCSFRWAIDESVNAWGSGNTKITIQNSIISETLMFATHSYSTDPTDPAYLRPHSMGALFGNASNNISIYNTVFAHNNQRNPLFGGVPSPGTNFEVVNCIIYNWGHFGTNFSGSSVRLNANLINTWHINGANTSSSRYPVQVNNDVKLFVRNNINSKRTSTAQAEWLAVGTGVAPYTANASTALQQLTTHNFPLKDEPFISTTDLLAELTAKAGALPRNAQDTRIFNEIASGTGELIDSPSDVGGYPTIAMGDGITDTDNDGIPDSEEGNFDNLFDYVNSLIDEQGEAPPTFVPLTTFGITETNETIAVGGTIQLDRFHTPSNASNSADTWTSSNNAVATVGGAGLVTGVSGGTVTITRFSLDTTNEPVLQDTCTITVTGESIPVTGVSIDQEDMYLSDIQIQLSATITPNDATNTNVTWFTDDNEIGAIDPDTGLLKFGKRAGEVRVGILTQDGNFSDEIVIKFFPKRKARLRIVN